MKSKITILFVAMIFLLGAGPLVRAQAPALAALYSFTNGSDGAYPYAGLILSNNVLYGTANGGGTAGNGTVFAYNLNGGKFISLYDFSATDTNYYNSDGAYPYNGLVLSGGTLYGTAFEGGTAGNGTVFAINTNGSGFVPLDSFPATGTTGFNYQGILPTAGLVLLSNMLYGTTFEGGDAGDGTVFTLSTNGSGFVPIYTFPSVDANGYNVVGADPYAAVALEGSTLYGTTAYGGPAGNGTIFSVNTDGGDFLPFYSFSATNAEGANADGASVEASLIVSGNRIYGTALYGGTSGNGTVFAINTDGTGFLPLHSFSGVDTNGYNSDGALPDDLILSGAILYGTTEFGGANGNGTVFSLYIGGGGFTTLYSFSATNADGMNSDGAEPNGVLLSSNVLYGTTVNGGTFGVGTVFALTLPTQPAQPGQPTIVGTSIAGANMAFSVTNGQAGQTYYVLTSTNLSAPLAQWAPVSTNVLSGGPTFTFTATNAVNHNDSAQFYRLEVK